MTDVPFGELLAEPLRNGVYKPKACHGRGVPVINMRELFAFDRLDGQAQDAVDLDANELERFGLRPGDLLFARRSFVLEGAGRCAIVRTLPVETAFESSIIRARLDPSKAVPGFYFYYFQSSFGRAAMSGIATQTAVSGITGTNLSRLKVPLPSLQVQHKILAVLLAYDDLIENNNRRIKLLDEMTQRIYREWFVDYCYPGHEMTPLVDSDLGLIPDGWQPAKIGERFTVVLGGTPSRTTERYWVDGTVPWINSGRVNDLRVTNESEWITKEALERSNTKLMPRGTTVLAITGATLGQVSLLEIDACANQSVIGVYGADDTMVEYLYLNISNSITAIISAASGGAQQHINKDIVCKTAILIPKAEVSDLFRDRVRPMFNQITDLLRIQHNLQTTRDLLLPRLISGGVDVSDLDIAIAEAAA